MKTVLTTLASDVGNNSVCAGGRGKKERAEKIPGGRARVGQGECRQLDLAMEIGSWQGENVSTGNSGDTSRLEFIGKGKDIPQPSWGGWHWKIKQDQS